MSHIIVGELRGVGTRKATCTEMTRAVTQSCEVETAQVTTETPDLGMDVAELKPMRKKSLTGCSLGVWAKRGRD